MRSRSDVCGMGRTISVKDFKAEALNIRRYCSECLEDLMAYFLDWRCRLSAAGSPPGNSPNARHSMLLPSLRRSRARSIGYFSDSDRGTIT